MGIMLLVKNAMFVSIIAKNAMGEASLIALNAMNFNIYRIQVVVLIIALQELS